MELVNLAAAHCLTAQQATAYKGRVLTEYDYDLCLKDDVIVLAPDNALVGILLKQVIPQELLGSVLPFLRTLRGDLTNRSTVIRKGAQMHRVREDGLPSPRKTVPKEVLEAHGGKGDQLGFLADRGGYNCRETRWGAGNPKVMEGCAELIELVDRIYRLNASRYYTNQLAKVLAIPREYRIGQTAFSTVTVNRNNRTAAHTDQGDVREGLGCLTTHGNFVGGHFIMPRFRIAFDPRPGDVLLANVHEFHGNGPMAGERISCVYYAMERLTACQTGKVA